MMTRLVMSYLHYPTNWIRGQTRVYSVTLLKLKMGVTVVVHDVDAVDEDDWKEVVGKSWQVSPRWMPVIHFAHDWLWLSHWQEP
jgi:hypothetical protein